LWFADQQSNRLFCDRHHEMFECSIDHGRANFLRRMRPLLIRLGRRRRRGKLVATTSGGCGWLGHRGPAGHCRPAFNRPPGFRTGPFGQVCHRV